jgi:hypothetical protein
MNKLISTDHHGVDVANLVGYWVNVNPICDFIGHLTLRLDDQQLVMAILAAPSEFDGKTDINVEAIASGNSQLAGGFSYFSADSELVIAANEKNGVLVLQCYRPIKTANGQAQQLTREFYHRLPQSPPNSLATPFRFHDPLDNQHFNQQFSTLLGTWHNTHASTEWNDELRIDFYQTSMLLHA